MGCSASSAAAQQEEVNGTAVRGKVGFKVDFPDGVVGERIKQSEWSKKTTIKRLKTFVPTLLQPILEQKGALQIYNQLKDEMIEKCLGNGVNPLAWNRAGIYELIRDKYQAMFKEKGLHVNMCYVEWKVVFNETLIDEARLWLEFCDLNKHPLGWESVTPGIPGSNCYDLANDPYDWETDLKGHLQGGDAAEPTARSGAESSAAAPAAAAPDTRTGVVKFDS